MENLGLAALDFLGQFAPFLALAAMLAAIVLAINAMGRRSERQDEWIRMLDARVANLTKARNATWARKLQRPFDALGVTEIAPLVPPPLPPRAPTLNATDWGDDNLNTEDLTRQTGRYPGGVLPKDPNDDDDPKT